MYKGKNIFLIIPAFNEEKNIKNVISRIPSFIDHIVVIDDGSTDKTAAKAGETGVKVFSHDSNQGVGIAFQSGVDYALNQDFDILVNIDGDGQFSPEEIPDLVEPLIENKADFVTGSRFMAASRVTNIPKLKKWGNRQMSSLISILTKKRFFDVSCGFRAYTRETLQRLNLQGSFTYTQESFIDLAFKKIRIKEVPIRVSYFSDRRSRTSHNLFLYTFQTLRTVFRTIRDYRPMAFFWTIGMFFVVFAIFFGLILLVHRINTGGFTGQIWAGFVGAFFFILGLSFFFIGIVGDILLRIRMNQESIIFLLRKTVSLPKQIKKERE